MSEYLDPEDELQEKNKKEKPGHPSERKNAGGSLEKKGPVKDKNYKVLHKDGSLADDLPYNNQPGGGALEGTVGIGT